MLGQTLTAIHLHRLINDLEQRIGHHDLALRNSVLARFIALEIHGVCGVEDYKTHGVNSHAHVGDTLDVAVEFADELAPRLLTGLDASDERQLVGAFGLADQSHAVVDATGSKTALGNLKSTSGTQDNVLDGNAHVLVDVLPVAFGRPIIPHDSEIPDLLQSG